MRLTGFLSLVASSLLLVTAVNSETRPHYGGSLHIALREAPVSLDPGVWNDTHGLAGLIFDNLVVIDAEGRAQPALATAWEAEGGNQRWHLTLRRGVAFSDGTPLTAESVAALLRAANPDWKVAASQNAVVIERDSPAPNLPAELALPRNCIVKREGGKILGTGPYAVAQFEPGRRIALAAREDYWSGRPFLDAIEIELGKSFREQAILFDLGKAQLIEVAPEQSHGVEASNRRVENSKPLELIALVFTRDAQSPDDVRQRDALSLSIDRNLLNTVVTQGGGEPAGGLLPGWLTGYSFLFPTEANLMRAQQERAEVTHGNLWNLGFDPTDPVARVMAERIVLNARDAGLRLQLAGANAADVRIQRVPLASLDAQLALEELARTLKLTPPKFGGQTIEDLYNMENAELQTKKVIPLLYLRSVSLASEKVKGMQHAGDGSWHLADAWVMPEKP